MTDIKKVSKLFGAITEYHNGQIRGWCYSSEQFEPLLLLNGRPCKIVKSNIPLSRVAEDNKFDRDDIGFVAEVTERFMGATDISLYATFSNSCLKITSTNKFTINNIAPRSLSVFNDLKQISSQKNPVAIVVWDVTHNPIGRAKVLYDIVKEKHPVIMIGFDFGFSKSEVWEPIASSDIKLLSIKWDERELYSRIMKDMDISFDTVWICKPRLPSFVLADMFSNKKTKFILDIDDNESEMSKDDAFLPKPYGLLGNHLVKSIVEKIDAKSVASISIKDLWGGEFVRHARIDIKPEKIKQRRKLPETIKIGFLGTVRPHKNIDKAAEMIQKIQRDHGIDLEFNVGGHFYPDELRKTIEKFGVKTYGMIPNAELFELLEDMDVLITGFPLDTNENEITKYQISSKIGDALSSGRPVLVPEGSSVKDLVDVPGIYLFNEGNFFEKLLDAINYSEVITLPPLFTLSDNYKMFKKLKKLASKKKKSEIFTVPLFPYSPQKNSETYRPTLVLLWKQPDSTLYGRRVDQLARSYKRKYPSHRVVLIETMNADQEKHYKSQKDYYIGDSSLILERLREKRITLELEDVEHIMLEDQMFNEEDYFRSFLLSQKMLPQNTLFVLFPLVGYFEKFFNIIDGYRYIADIVDNQLGWKSQYPEKKMKQYKIICKNAENVIFNSENNRQFFIDHGLLEEREKSLQIANWYELPETAMGEELS
ncbi:MAG: glycosyltransferase, partial [Bacteroidales bacterium]|nr:glycosyltransferase [Bacteroidales bacterium]